MQRNTRESLGWLPSIYYSKKMLRRGCLVALKICFIVKRVPGEQKHSSTQFIPHPPLVLPLTALPPRTVTEIMQPKQDDIFKTTAT